MVQLRAFISIVTVVVFLILQTGCSTLPTLGKKSEGKSTVPQELTGPAGNSFSFAVNAMQTGDYKQAISGFKQVISAQPKLAVPYINLAISYRQLNDLDNAVAAIRQAIHNAPQSSEAYNVQGIIQREKGLFTQALKSYKKSIKLNNKSSDAYLNLAILCELYLQDLDCAMKNYKNYQAFSKSDDKQLKGWLADLQRRMKKGT